MATPTASVPARMKGLRACVTCRLVKNEAQFLDDGCENCGEIERIHSETSPTFHGLVAVMNPSTSWVAKWRRQDKAAAGMYAIKVVKQNTDR
jgi:transcription elongation factor SPT4